mmetsp:Transcript_9911/g.12600  ORF Transcript_9911/g.12600 Transcript_9911/m.12600 type:complete len:280 (-) Transcript_9911:187-1026(-)
MVRLSTVLSGIALSTTLCAALPLDMKLSSWFGTSNDGDVAVVSDSKDTKKSTTSLQFVGSFTHQSEPAPLPDNGKDINDFFNQKEKRRVLLEGSGEHLVTPIEKPTPEIRQRWKKEAKIMGSTPPSSDDNMYLVTIKGVNFPGIKMNTIATIGTKVMLNSDFPEYQATMAMSDTKPEGLRPLVWVVNKLTGASTEMLYEDQTTHSFTRVRAEVNNGEVIFKAESNLVVDLKFPSFLLKILPASKEKVEEQGSEALQKALEKDVVPMINNFREEYIKYLL